MKLQIDSLYFEDRILLEFEDRLYIIIRVSKLVRICKITLMYTSCIKDKSITNNYLVK